MDRRGFLRRAVTAAAGVALAPIAAKLLPTAIAPIPAAKPATNFAALSQAEIKVWSRATWEAAQPSVLVMRGILKPRFNYDDFGVIAVDAD